MYAIVTLSIVKKIYIFLKLFDKFKKREKIRFPVSPFLMGFGRQCNLESIYEWKLG